MQDDAALTVDKLVRCRAAQHGDKQMVIDPFCRLSYRELEASTGQLAATFVHAGVGKGTRVGLIMPNGVRWVQVALALTRIGAVLVPLSTLLQSRELVAQLRVASVQFLVSVEEFRGHRYLAADALEKSCSRPTASTPPATSAISTTTASCSITADPMTCSKSAAPPSTPAKSKRRCGSSRVSRMLWLREFLAHKATGWVQRCCAIPAP